jgi:dihydrofolate synthase/folylpolyglutamate synthase
MLAEPNTSPHLSEFTERITINGVQISKEDVVKYARTLKDIRERINSETDFGYATYFEVVTAMALQYFADSDLDYVILEVGLGGTFDATNVVYPILSVITDVSLDHTEYLGETLASVAENKAGIIKPKTPVITSNTNPEILDVIENKCTAQRSKCYRLGKDLNFSVFNSSRDGFDIDYSGMKNNYKDLHVKLVGEHQGINTALALGTLELFSEIEKINISEEAVRHGLDNINWPGRMELVQSEPWVILDGAHNPAGAKALSKAIGLFDHERLFLVFGCSEEKDISQLLDPLIPLADRIYITKANIRRAAEPGLIKNQLKDINIIINEKIPVSSAVDAAISEANSNDLVCICGSLFVVGEARERLVPDRDSDAGSTKVKEKVHRIHY